MRQPFRLDPKLPAQAMKTYQVTSPISTHYRPSTCDEVNCQAQAHGWRSVIDESTDLGARQAHYIRAESGRKYREQRDPAGLTSFVFEAGQRCFQQHQVPLDRPELYLVRDGDWRGNPHGTQTLRHTSADAWLNDFAEHQETLRKAQG